MHLSALALVRRRKVRHFHTNPNLPKNEMKKPKPLTAYQVLHAWLETQIGACSSMRPRGFETPGDSLSTWSDTRARAAAIVEGLPLYDLCRLDLIKWCQVGLHDLGLVVDFLDSLEKHLADYPFYASKALDNQDAARITVVYKDLPTVAAELGVTPKELRKMLCDMPISLPFGTFCEKRYWRIHPLDIPVLKQTVEAAVSHLCGQGKPGVAPVTTPA